MIAAAGLQCGFGEPIDPAVLEHLRTLGYVIVRLDLQHVDQVTTTRLAQQVLDAGLQPLCIIRRAEQMTILPEGSLIELGNEPNLEHEGWTLREYIEVANHCVRIAVEHHLRLYLGVISNLNIDGFSFLQKLPWGSWPASNACCSIHRYPEGHSPHTPHTGFDNREDEVAHLKAIVGARPLACTEVGYHDSPTGWTEDEVAHHLAWERQFFSSQGFEICSAYQINDGPRDGQPINYYGFRRSDSTWKPVAEAFADAMNQLPVVTTTLKSSGGYFVCAERGGGIYVIVDRPAAGPWETWAVQTYDDGRVSLQAHTGQYLGVELDGSVIARADMAGEWERFTIEVRDDAIVAFKSFHGSYLQAPLGGGANSRMTSAMTVPGEWEFFASSTKFWTPPTPPPPVTNRPLIGPLRIENKLFRDDSGVRRVFFCSWFVALRVLRDNPAEFYRQLDAIATAGYQGIRVFLTVGGWSDFWDGREVVPKSFVKWWWTGNFLRTDSYGGLVEAWPDYDDLLRTLLRECRARKLRLHVTTGDMQIICPDAGEEIALHQRFARICAEEGGTDVIALAEVTNEYPINRYGGDSDASIAQMGRVIVVWTTAIPGLLVTAQGAIPQAEEPQSLYRSSTYGTVCSVHVSRSPFDLCLKRTFGLIYWDGQWRYFPKPFWQSEPAGPGEDSFDEQDDPANLTALYAMAQITGQATNRFQGAAVRCTKPLESEWGFTELPALFAEHIPEDIALWSHGNNGRGGIEYFWQGNDFITVTYADWDPTPPRPVASWTLYTGTSVHTGTGPIAHGNKRMRGAARATGLLVGKFA